MILRQLTGGDTVRGRYLYSESFEFQPTCAIAIGTNHRLKIKGTEKNIRRRLRVIECRFDPEKSGKKPNLRLKYQLRNEYPGILHKLIQEAREYIRLRDAGEEPFPPCEKIKEWSEEFVNRQDTVLEFIYDECIQDPQ
jgi:putative DNA primase/helicase